MMPAKRWYQRRRKRFPTFCRFWRFPFSIADTWSRYPNIKMKSAKAMFTTRKRLFFRSFLSFAKTPIVRKFPATISAGRLPIRKQRTVLFLLPVKELSMACMRKTYYLHSCQLLHSSFFFCMNFFFLDVSRTWSTSRCGKTEDIYVVALKTLYHVCRS